MNFNIVKFLFLVNCLLISSCSEVVQISKSDLRKIYSKSAQYHGVKRNPVIVIPGVLGSKLVTKKTGEVAWGAFGGEYVDPSTKKGFKTIAFPISGMVSKEDNFLVPDGALDRVKLDVFGLPVSLNQYFEIITSLGAGGYKDQQIASASGVDYGKDHISCFQFAYDWRKDVSSITKDFEQFIEEKRSFLKTEYLKRGETFEEPIKFDIIAHSMGGLVARYYLRYGSKDINEVNSNLDIPWYGSKDISKLVLIGTPSSGSIEVFDALINGRKYSFLYPRYQAQLLATMPALYGILPRPRHKHIVWSDTKESVDIYDPKVWQENRWGLFKEDKNNYLKILLPGIEKEEREEIAFSFITETLDRAKRIHQALDRKSQKKNPVPVTLFTGDAIPTANVLEVSHGKNINMKYIESAPGDGLVLRSSALADERIGGKFEPFLNSPIKFRHVMFLFGEHVQLLKGPTFTDNLLFYLLEHGEE